MLPKKRILSIDVSCGSFNQFMDEIVHYGTRNISSYVCVANVHMLVEAHNSPEFQTIVNGSDLCTPDGMPIARSFYALHKLVQERVDGMSMLPAILNRCQDEGLSVFFYGASQSMLDSTSDFLKHSYPQLKLAGVLSPPFRDLTESEIEENVETIKRAEPNIVFVVLGCPKQERWMASMKGKIPAIMIGIGGALPVLIGAQKRAPKWMQQNSLEWLYRLKQEPRRLFKRYLFTNITFLSMMLMKKRKKSS